MEELEISLKILELNRQIETLKLRSAACKATLSGIDPVAPLPLDKIVSILDELDILYSESLDDARWTVNDLMARGLNEDIEGLDINWLKAMQGHTHAIDEDIKRMQNDLKALM